MKFSLIIPLWNEETNISQLVKVISDSNLPALGMEELVLVNNASTDTTGILIEKIKKEYEWIVTLHLPENENYGGGVYEGIKLAKSSIVCYIPGDLQVMPDDVLKLYNEYKSHSLAGHKLLVKGRRTVRHDPLQTRIVSAVYTFLANLLLGLKIKDVNGLPKMFSRELVALIPAVRFKTFVFDTQLLSIARVNDWCIEEVPVTFHGRLRGVSSWSKKRIFTYFITLRQIYKLRQLRYIKVGRDVKL